MDIQIATIDDWDGIRAIYRDGILTGDATFNTVEHIPTAEAWFNGKVPEMTFKAIDHDGAMLGWSTLSITSKRAVYRGVTEISVYVANSAKGRGIGSALMAHTLDAAEKSGIWMIEARIFPNNIGSIRLHEKFGFRVLGIHDKRAQQFGVWRDVAYLEWRSSTNQPQIKLANHDELATIKALLTRAELPTADLSSDILFLLLKMGEETVGCVGLERFGDAALLRSVAIDEGMRGRDFGTLLVNAAEQFAAGRAINTLWLLTTTAAPFFAKLGYTVVERNSAPSDMQQSAEFSALCPESAVCMTKTHSE